MDIFNKNKMSRIDVGNFLSAKVTGRNSEIKLMFFLVYRMPNYWHWTAWLSYAYMLLNYGDIPMVKLSEWSTYECEECEPLNIIE